MDWLTGVLQSSVQLISPLTSTNTVTHQMKHGKKKKKKQPLNATMGSEITVTAGHFHTGVHKMRLCWIRTAGVTHKAFHNSVTRRAFSSIIHRWEEV